MITALFDEHDQPVDYRILEVNRAFEKQTGIRNAVGRRMREISPEQEQYWFDIYGNVVKSGEQPWGKDVPLIALSGWGTQDDKRKTQAAGFDEHLVKPAEVAVIQSVLAGL